MKFIADFHIHSKYSRATAKNLDIENLYINAQIKGISVLGTSDFTHPAWWREINEKLQPAEEGLFKLNPDIARVCDEKVPVRCRRPLRFMLVTEISNIYKKNGRTRKNHNLVFMPDLEAVAKLNRRLDEIGNIQSDGRPILGLDARNLLEIVLETAEEGFLVPAHIWTPWFSLLGSKSGFDKVEECFEDLTPHIFALETGLSSDPPMNRRVSHLDGYTLISNSDAHSPSKLGREANLFSCDLGYGAMKTSIQTGDPNRFLGTIEFYPEEGKYHVDGHRKCGFRCDPSKTRDMEGLCPVCGKPLTLGVLYRVEELADRDQGATPVNQMPYRSLIPLEQVLSEVLQVGPNTKKVKQAYSRLIETLGSEFDILCHAEREDINNSNIPLLDEALIRMREGNIKFDPGYDGEFGMVRIFNASERDLLQGQQSLFDVPDTAPERPEPSMEIPSPIDDDKTHAPTKQPVDQAAGAIPEMLSEPESAGFKLNEEQQSAVDHVEGPLLICAGPGTGKTRTITCRMAKLIEEKGVAPDKLLAVTFTNKAAQEMAHRLETMLAPNAQMPLSTTFHGFCWQALKEFYDNDLGSIVDDAGRGAVLADAIDMAKGAGQAIDLSQDWLTAKIIEAKQKMLEPSDDLSPIVSKDHLKAFSGVYGQYQQLMTLQELLDFEDLIFQTVKVLQQDRQWRNHMRRRFSHIFVDEFQDINGSQYRLLKSLAPPKSNVCIIGDPDQAIYGFRGSDVTYFNRFAEDYHRPRRFHLNRNYRSTQTILTSSYQVIEGRQRHLMGEPSARTYSGIDGVSTISVLESASARSEAVAIGRTIEQMVGGTGFHSIDFEKLDPDNHDGTDRSFADFAVFCRTGDQVQSIARQLTAAGIPCQWVSRRILQQPATSKLLAAFRIITQQGAYADLAQLIDLGASGISKETLGMFKQWAYHRQLPLATALHTVNRLPIPNMSTNRQQRLISLVRLLERLQNSCADLNADEALNQIVNQTTLSSKIGEEELNRLTDLARPYKKDKAAFCTALALQRDTDLYHTGVEKVSIMTLHAAKGLEFPVVFMAGCEDNLLPYRHPGKSASDVEEERRLFYVGMTRAAEQLFLSWSRRRTMFGQTQTQKVSPFVMEIEAALKTRVNPLNQTKQRQQQLTLF